MKTIERPPELRQEARRILEAISSPERYDVMLTLSHHSEGLSFSQLAKIFTTNHNTLNRHLKTLTHATLVWNFYERREGKDHSFYKLSALGERVLGSLRPELEPVRHESPIHRDRMRKAAARTDEMRRNIGPVEGWNSTEVIRKWRELRKPSS